MITIDCKETFDKQKLYIDNMKYMLNRLQSMFSYENLPSSIPENELEGILIKHGSAFITDIEGVLYAFPYTPVDDLDVYGNFTKVNVTNVALNIGKTFSIDEGVICDNDYMRMGLFPLMSKYSMLLAENTITMKNVNIMLRMTSIISASDNQTKASADLYIKKILDGDFAIITSNPFFEGVKVQNSTGVNANYTHQFLEYQQYLKGSFFNELGLNANFNMKASPVGANESALNRDFLHPLIDSMKEQRDIFVKSLNEKYGLDISIDFNSSWKLEQEEKENEEKTVLNHETTNALQLGLRDDSEEKENGDVLQEEENGTDFNKSPAKEETPDNEPSPLLPDDETLPLVDETENHDEESITDKKEDEEDEKDK